MQENRFHYTYTAPTEEERKEIDSIRRQYTADGEAEGRLVRLRRLHARVKNGATSLALCLGIGGCLLFGLGLAMVLEWKVIVWGVLVAAVGALPMACAYPVYTWRLKRNKAKYGGEIIKLSEELLAGKE